MRETDTTPPNTGRERSQAAQYRAEAIRILLALAEVDPTVSGATLILPDGTVAHIDAATLGRGDSA